MSMVGGFLPLKEPQSLEPELWAGLLGTLLCRGPAPMSSHIRCVVTLFSSDRLRLGVWGQARLSAAQYSPVSPGALGLVCSGLASPAQRLTPTQHTMLP